MAGGHLRKQMPLPVMIGLALLSAALSTAPAAHADNKRLNDGVVANVYTIQHQAGCTSELRIDPRLQLAAEWHTNDVLGNRALDGDIGSDGSTAKVQLRRGPTGFGVALRAHAVGPNAGSHPHRLGVARTAGRDDAGGDRGYPGREGGTPWRVQAVRAGRRRPGCGRRSWWRGPAQRRRRGCANQNRQQPGHGRSFGKPGPHGRKAALRAGSRSGCRWLCGHRMLISSPRGLHRWTRANRDTSIKPHQKHQDEVQRPSLSDVHKC
ncbi:conserved secreted protein [Mycobacterium liflandii 128FXT]|uniref:Conserved secreted protein n=1 Tax=Mycobacterium liflandii (strain 128FXT) TaxID=459424 RepID=L7VBI1_MYCL1|nr:conserved secreted protein [Mycobacterium liflandii 128FXT]